MSKFIIFIGVSVIVILAFTFASFVVLTKVDPAKEVIKMVHQMSQLESFEQQTALIWTESGQEPWLHNFQIKGLVSLNQLNGLEYDLDFDLISTQLNKDFSELTGKIKQDQKSTFLYYDPPGPKIDGLVSDLADQWIKVDRSERLVWGALIPGLDLPFLGPLKNRAWSNQQLEQLKEMFKTMTLFDLSFNNETEVINKIETRIIRLEFKPQTAKKYLTTFFTISNERQPNNQEQLKINQQAKQLEQLTLHFWIGIKDHYLYRLHATGPVGVLTNFSNFDQGSQIKIPTKYLSLKQLQLNRPEFLPQAKTSTTRVGQVLDESKVARLPVTIFYEDLDTDGDGLTNILERFYGTDPSNKDTDQDGRSDGAEVWAGQNPRGSGTLFDFGLTR
ncbi:hypothetical protein ACFLZY_01155 [Patescibacteria group bacterium]